MVTRLSTLLVEVAPGWKQQGDAGDGPLGEGDVGVIIAHDGGQSVAVKALASSNRPGRSRSSWHYQTAALQLITLPPLPKEPKREANEIATAMQQPQQVFESPEAQEERNNKDDTVSYEVSNAVTPHHHNAVIKEPNVLPLPDPFNNS
jgi:hypothetical protein